MDCGRAKAAFPQFLTHMERLGPRRLEVVAHRGGYSPAPENSLRAFVTAAHDGADAFECDVAFTRDHQPVIIHIPFYSDDISQLVGSETNLSKVDWHLLRSMKVHGEEIPHLTDLLRFVAADKIHCFIEPKRNSMELLEQIIKGVQAFALEQQVTVITFWSRRLMLQRAKALLPAVRTAVIVTLPFRNWATIAKEACADIVILGWSGYNHWRHLEACGVGLRARVKAVQATGVLVYGGIADKEKEVEWLCDLGADGLFTNNVALAKKVVDSKGSG